NALGAARTVNGGRRVFQDGDGLDSVRVELVHGLFDTVYQHQRVIIVERSNAADADGGAVDAGLGVAEVYEEAGCSGECVGDVGDGPVFDLGRVEHGNGAGEGGFLLGAVPYDHGFVEFLDVFQQLHINGGGFAH